MLWYLPNIPVRTDSLNISRLNGARFCLPRGSLMSPKSILIVIEPEWSDQGWCRRNPFNFDWVLKRLLWRKSTIHSKDLLVFLDWNSLLNRIFVWYLSTLHVWYLYRVFVWISSSQILERPRLNPWQILPNLWNSPQYYLPPTRLAVALHQAGTKILRTNIRQIL